MMDEMKTGQGGMVCKCPHHMMPGLFVTLFGLLFLGQAFGWWSGALVDFGWPILVIAGGLMKMSERKCKCC